MKIINKNLYISKKTFAIFFILILFICCKKNSINNDIATKSVKIQDSTHLQLIDIARFFDKPKTETDVERFTKNKVYFDKNTISINDIKINVTIQQLNPQKILGKGSLYDFFSDYISQKYKLKLPNKVSYINVEYEDATKEPFRNFFLDGKSAIIIDHYLFLYSNDDYLLTYKIKKNDIATIDTVSKNDLVALPFDYEEYTKICVQETSSNCSKRYPIIEKYKYDEIINIIGLEEGLPTSIFYLKTNFNNNFETYLLDYEGDSSSQEIVTISNNKVINIMPLGYAMPENDTYDTFIINTDMTIDIYEVDYTDFSKKKKKEVYKISPKGKII